MPVYSLTIPEIAKHLEISEREVRGKTTRFNWQSTGERVQGGGDKYNLDTIRFYKSDEKHAAGLEKIKNKIRDEKIALEQDQEAAAIATRLTKIKEQIKLEQLSEAEEEMTHEDREWLWQQMGKKGTKQQDKAIVRSKAVAKVKSLLAAGEWERHAIEQVAKELGVHEQSVRGWVRKTRDCHPSDRAAVLVNQIQGKGEEAEFTFEAWEAFKKDYLRRKCPSYSSCYRRLQAAATLNGWIIPTKKTVENWIKRKVDVMVIKFRREGMEAVEKCFPAMKRNKDMFDVMQAVNGDGYALGIWADFGNGTIVKPIVWSWQDIRSSKVLAWRMDISENRELVRLATLDLITDWGIPEFMWLDNTRAATSKQISGGLPNRYRFKVKDDDPLGIMPLLGIDLKYTLPGHGQSKPVERVHGIGGYLDFDTLPVFEGRGTKGRPVPIAEVEELFKNFVNEINARPDRRGDSVKGKSFDQVFNELYPETIITRATEKQRKYCMCVAEVVTVSRTNAEITLKAGRSDGGENRYWNNELIAHMGQKVTVRFDPANLHSPVYVETISGVEICTAEPSITGGFKDAAAAREHARNKGHFKKHVKLAAEAIGRNDLAESRRYMGTVPEPEKPQSKVTRLAAGVPTKGKAATDQDSGAAEIPVSKTLQDLFPIKKVVNGSDCEHDTETAAALWEKGAAKLYGKKSVLS